MFKNLFKFFSIIFVLVLSFFTLYTQSFADEDNGETTLTGKVTRTYSLEKEKFVSRTIDFSNDFGVYAPKFINQYLGYNNGSYEASGEILYDRGKFKPIENSGFVCNQFKNGNRSDTNWVVDCKYDDLSKITSDPGNIKEEIGGRKFYNIIYGYEMAYKKYYSENDETLFPETLNLTFKNEVVGYWLSGEKCGNSTNPSGCVELQNEIMSDELDSTKPMIKYTYSSKASINKIRNEILNEYVEQNNLDSSKYVCNGNNTSKLIDLQINGIQLYDFCNYTSYITGVEYDNRSNIIYEKINAMEKISHIDISSEKNTYVCIGARMKDELDNNDTRIDDSGYVIVTGVTAKNADEASEKCGEYMVTDYSKSSSINNFRADTVSNPGIMIYSYGVYKVTDIKEDKDQETLPNINGGMTCEWTHKTNSDADVDLSLSFGINYQTGQMKFVGMKNISKFNYSIKFSPDDMRQILAKRDRGILENIANSIYNDKKEVDTGTWVVVGITAFAVVATVVAVLTAIPTGGASILAWVKFGLTIAAASLTIGGTITLAIVAGPTLAKMVDIVIADTGNYNATAYLFYNNIYNGNYVVEGIDKKSGVTCKFGEFTDKFDIKPNVKVECETIMDGKFGDIIKYIMNILRFVACGILILFSVIDFVKPIISGDAEMLTKSGKTFVKRLIIFVLILFLPAVITLLLELIGQSSCNI